MPDIELKVAEPHERSILENMMQLYIHDFSEFWAGREEGELGPDGRFFDYPLDAYWRDPDHTPLLLSSGGRLAGFALLNAASHSGRPLNRNMAEFFIVRKHRRGGVGTAAAQAIFSRYPGVWETAVARANLPALAFWRKAAVTHPKAQGVEEADFATAEWNGPILRFVIG